MKQVCIHYRAGLGGGEIKTSITIPMEDERAECLLADQRVCWMLLYNKPADTLLRMAAKLQGYEYRGFIKAEEA